MRGLIRPNHAPAVEPVIGSISTVSRAWSRRPVRQRGRPREAPSASCARLVLPPSCTRLPVTITAKLPKQSQVKEDAGELSVSAREINHNIPGIDRLTHGLTQINWLAWVWTPIYHRQSKCCNTRLRRRTVCMMKLCRNLPAWVCISAECNSSWSVCAMRLFWLHRVAVDASADLYWSSRSRRALHGRPHSQDSPPLHLRQHQPAAWVRRAARRRVSRLESQWKVHQGQQSLHHSNAFTLYAQHGKMFIVYYPMSQKK